MDSTTACDNMEELTQFVHKSFENCESKVRIDDVNERLPEMTIKADDASLDAKFCVIKRERPCDDVDDDDDDDDDEIDIDNVPDESSCIQLASTTGELSCLSVV